MPDNDIRDALIAPIRDAIESATKRGICFDTATVATDAALSVISRWTANEPDESKATYSQITIVKVGENEWRVNGGRDPEQ